jgi:spore germination cell wall hydrolase CwlJ-like protein
MRSRPILFSILISAIILIFAITHTNQNKYLIPLNIKYHTLSTKTQKQIDCLAENMLYEAGNQSREGQIAVAMVTLNRVASGNYATDICGVVKQRTNGVCQFSWVCHPILTEKHLTEARRVLYNDIRNLAIYVFMNYENMEDVTRGATYFHADYVSPNWGLPKTTKIGAHIFYKSNKDLKTMNKDIKL